jgi:type II secretory pathway component PulC
MTWTAKLAPSILVLSLAGYCCCPETPPALMSPDTAAVAMAAAKAPVPAVSVVEIPQRNPFVRTAPEPPRQQAPGLTAAEFSKQLEGIVLKGILIVGQRRVALIDNGIYGEGEPLLLARRTLAVIAQVHEDRVLLARDGQSFELTYGTRPAADNKQHTHNVAQK